MTAQMAWEPLPRVDLHRRDGWVHRRGTTKERDREEIKNVGYTFDCLIVLNILDPRHLQDTAHILFPAAPKPNAPAVPCPDTPSVTKDTSQIGRGPGSP